MQKHQPCRNLAVRYMLQPANNLQIIECPRDAMQGLHDFIPTATKIKYIQSLLSVGFDTLDCGSFVSPKYIPQMADTAEVLRALDLSDTKTRLSVIVANTRGAEEAAGFEQVDFMGYPFSISETFQVRNTNSTIMQALDTVKQLQEICTNADKEFVLYISMAFGNPYGDPWNIEVVEKWVEEMQKLGIKYLSLSDTVGVADAKTITYLYTELIKRFPKLEFGAHFHTNPNTWRDKVEPAYLSGCRRFDGAIKGFGGCPMAKDDLVGNMPTERLVEFFDEMKIETGLDKTAFGKAMAMAGEVFPV